jgi:hypothetical protein
MTNGTKVLICHNCGGFGYTLGPGVSICHDREADGGAASADGLADETVDATLVYECGACSGAGYLTI